jgi:CRISPR/Cas system-associated endoribonuclease Cas2
LLEETQKLRLTESHAEIAKADASKWEKLAKDAESKVTSLEITLKDMKGIADQRVRDSIAASEVKVAASEKLLRDTREHLQRSVIQAEAATEQAATSHKLAVNLQLRIDELLRSDSAPIIASMQQQLVAAAAKQKLVADAAAAAQADFARVSRELSSSQAALAVAHADLSLNSKLLQEERDLVSRVRVQLSEALLRVQHAEAELESEHLAHSMMEHQLRAQKAKVETTNNINRLNLLIRIAGTCFLTLCAAPWNSCTQFNCRGVQAGGYAEGRQACGDGSGGGHSAACVQHQRQ